MSDEPDIVPGDVVVCLSRDHIHLMEAALADHMAVHPPGADYLTAGWLRGYLGSRLTQHMAMQAELRMPEHQATVKALGELCILAAQGRGLPVRPDLAEQAWRVLVDAERGDETVFARFAAAEILAADGPDAQFRSFVDPPP